MDNEDKIIQGIANTYTEKPKYEFTIQIDEPIPVKRSFWEWITRKPKKEPITERHFIIHPCKVINMPRVAGTALELPKELISGDLATSTMPLIPQYIDTMVYIIAAAIQNNTKEPSKKLITFIKNNFDNIDIFNALYRAFDGLEMESFLNSIVSARGTVTILKPKANPMDGSELIASYTQSSDLQSDILDGSQVK